MFEGKFVCVGRNYAEHARELNNEVPTSPLLFIKPASAYVPLEGGFKVPADDCHYEAELAVVIGEALSQANSVQAMSAIRGYALALDLTKRDLQSKLKAQGHPWELAKAFDGACPMSPEIPRHELADLEELEFRMHLNGELKQHGRVRDMITGVPQLLAYISQHFTLKEGDVVLTGTPAGVGPISPGDEVTLTLQEKIVWRSRAI